ncbi:unnamed protein product, partial [Mesorhabditis belari]|uniref:C-type lectin domain-containing protein n=1 Tax=Mesorhabditis belari TaxID=2138241 RepID=A0AAF3F5U6_9BILA
MRELVRELAKIQNAFENSFIYRIVDQNLNSAAPYIGVRRNDDNTWTYSDGLPLKYENWAPKDYVPRLQNGPTNRTTTCPRTPCAGNKCCFDHPLVKNLVTNKTQCGLQLAPDQVLHPPGFTDPECIEATTPLPPTTTRPPCGSGCAQNLSSYRATGENGTLIFTYTTDGAGCLTATYSCRRNDFPNKNMFFGVMTQVRTGTRFFAYIKYGNPVISDSAHYFLCSPSAEWDYVGSTGGNLITAVQIVCYINATTSG